jgi:hypothetical protein
MSTVERALSGAAIEVTAKATGRRFTTDRDRKIVREADECKSAGAVGALLRRERLYSSHLTTWRAARERGDLAGPTVKTRGPVPLHEERPLRSFLGNRLNADEGVGAS